MQPDDFLCSCHFLCKAFDSDAFESLLEEFPLIARRTMVGVAAPFQAQAEGLAPADGVRAID